jgi:hypothetical protein
MDMSEVSSIKPKVSARMFMELPAGWIMERTETKDEACPKYWQAFNGHDNKQRTDKYATYDACLTASWRIATGEAAA